MPNKTQTKPAKPVINVEFITALSQTDMNDLCDATDAAIESGGGFGWLTLPAREVLEGYWHGVVTMPVRLLFVARLDGVICGTAQIICPPRNNEAQNFAVCLTTNFIAPWARKYGLARLLLEKVEDVMKEKGYGLINLDVRETQQAAITLYEDMGYVYCGTHPYYARVNDKIIPGRHYYKVIDPSLLD